MKSVSHFPRDESPPDLRLNQQNNAVRELLSPMRYAHVVVGLENSALKACVLIKVRPGRHNKVAEKVAELSGVLEAFWVMGTADVVARVEVKDLKAMTALGTKIGNLKDIITTETLVAAEA